MEASLIGFAALLLIAFIGFPLGFSMMMVGFFGFAYFRGWGPALEMVGQQIVELSLSSGFAVLPLFVLMGLFIHRANLSSELYEVANAWVGHRRGGLAMATVVACAGFSAVSGSSAATAATMAKVALPPMRRYRYADGLAAGAVAAGGTLGILIPPSNAMVIYGILTEQDIGKLFIAGIVPGVLTVVLYLAAIATVTHLSPEAGPPGERKTFRERIRLLAKVWGIVLLFLLVLGGIYLGVFTPSEAGGIGAVGALLFALGRRCMSWSGFKEALIEGVKTTAMIFTVAFGAMILNNFVNISGLPNVVTTFVQSAELSPFMVVVVICAIYIVLGCVVEGIGMILLTVPIFYPIVQALGFDMIWFGILVIIVTEISFITPPIGLNLFIMKTMLPDVPLLTIYKGVVPFLMADIVRIAIVLLVPAVVLFLPNLMS
jgi:tripartite ATP-independent transporter DctM subunit